MGKKTKISVRTNFEEEGPTAFPKRDPFSLKSNDFCPIPEARA
mgnify:CR=1 FL=1